MLRHPEQFEAAFFQQWAKFARRHGGLGEEHCGAEKHVGFLQCCSRRVCRGSGSTNGQLWLYPAMTTHSVTEAKNHLPELIDRALKGESVVITRVVASLWWN